MSKTSSVSPANSATMDITPQSCRKFRAKPGELFQWINIWEAAQCHIVVTNIKIIPAGQLQVPWTPHRSRQHPVSLSVVDKFLFFGIPSEIPAQPYGNIILVADGVRANSGFDGANRFLSGLNAIQEIATMISRSRQMYLIGTNS